MITKKLSEETKQKMMNTNPIEVSFLDRHLIS